MAWCWPEAESGDHEGIGEAGGVVEPSESYTANHYPEMAGWPAREGLGESGKASQASYWQE